MISKTRMNQSLGTVAHTARYAFVPCASVFDNNVQSAVAIHAARKLSQYDGGKRVTVPSPLRWINASPRKKSNDVYHAGDRMPVKLSKYFKTTAAELRKHGVLNAHLGIDNLLFVDPNLLKGTKLPEFRDARADLENYFRPVIKLLKASSRAGDLAWVEAKKRLTFEEEHGAALGYSNAGGFGRGIGSHLASILVTRGQEIVRLGIDAAEMFELIGLFQERFGPDLLSDMAVAILKQRFLTYTQRITTELNLRPQRKFFIARGHGRDSD